MNTQINYEHYTALAPACLADHEECLQSPSKKSDDETVWSTQKNYCLWPPEPASVQGKHE